MTKSLNDPLWRARVSTMTSSEKDEELRLSITLRFYDRVKYLIENENLAVTSPPRSEDLLSYAIKEVCDFQMTDLLLDLGARADHCVFADLQYFFYEDRHKTFNLIVRMAGAGLPLSERAQAAAVGLSDKRFHLVNQLALPEEDMYLFIDHIREFDFRNLWPDIKIDNKPYERQYDAHFEKGITLDKLTARVAGEKGMMTGYTLAVRAGRFGDVAAAFIKNAPWQMDVDDIMDRDGCGASAIELLAYRRQLDMLFQPHLWYKTPTSTEMLIRAVPSRFFKDIDPNKIMREIKLCVLSKRSSKRNKNKFKL